MFKNGASMNEDLRAVLVVFARRRDVTFYSDICHHLGIEVIQGDGDVATISEALAEIAVYEYRHGRPLLSAVVINKNENGPGGGFFTVAAELGCFRGGDRDAFFPAELGRVHEYWTQH
jgi:hypothetical protein